MHPFMFSSKFTDHDRTTEHSRSLRSLAALFNFLSLMLLELVFRALALQLRCPKNRNRFSFVRFKTALIKTKSCFAFSNKETKQNLFV